MPINWGFYDEHSVRIPGFEVLAFLFSVELSDDQVTFAKETMAEIIPFLKTLSAEPTIQKKIISVLFILKDLVLIRGFFADLMLKDSLDAKAKELDLILRLIELSFEFGLKFKGLRSDQIIEEFIEFFIEKGVVEDSRAFECLRKECRNIAEIFRQILCSLNTENLKIIKEFIELISKEELSSSPAAGAGSALHEEASRLRAFQMVRNRAASLDSLNEDQKIIWQTNREVKLPDSDLLFTDSDNLGDLLEQYLIHEILDGGRRVFVIKDSSGKVLKTCPIELALKQEIVVLYLYEQETDAHIIKIAMEKARAMGVQLFSNLKSDKTLEFLTTLSGDRGRGYLIPTG